MNTTPFIYTWLFHFCFHYYMWFKIKVAWFLKIHNTRINTEIETTSMSPRHSYPRRVIRRNPNKLVQKHNSVETPYSLFNSLTNTNAKHIREYLFRNRKIGFTIQEKLVSNRKFIQEHFMSTPLTLTLDVWHEATTLSSYNPQRLRHSSFPTRQLEYRNRRLPHEHILWSIRTERKTQEKQYLKFTELTDNIHETFLRF